jgi:glycosyltransferase involved in cell wall biosynthesis
LPAEERLSGPTVTVVVPCFNTHRLIGEAIASVCAQTFKDIELLVVDDGSTDPETLACLAALPPDIRVVHQENRGLPAARNTGMRLARGRYVMPLDCDDRLEPTMIAACVEAAERTGAAYAYAAIALVGDAAGVVSKPFNFFEQLATNNLPYCLLMRRDIWEQVGGYDEAMRLGYEDWELNIRLGAAGHFGVQVPQPLFVYRVSSTGMLNSVSKVRHALQWGKIRRRHRALYRPLGLWRLFRDWRGRPSTHPLWLVWVLLALNGVLPGPLFSTLFVRLHRTRRAVARVR